MQQHDSPRMDTAGQLFKGLLMAGLAVLVPVHIGQAPEECGVPQVFRHLQIRRAVFPLGRPIVHRQFRPCHLPEQRRHIVHFFLERRLIRNLGHIRMMICMIAHRMAVLHHAPGDVRRRLQKMPHHEEGGRGIVFFQRVQDRFRVAVLVAAVKSQIDHLLLPFPAVVRIVLGKLRHGCVPGGLLARLPESQPPVLAFLQQPAGGLLRLRPDFRRLSAQEEHAAEKGQGGQGLFPVYPLGLQQLLYHVLHINRLHFPLSISQSAIGNPSPGMTHGRFPMSLQYM